MKPQLFNVNQSAMWRRTKLRSAKALSKSIALFMAVLVAFPANVMAFSFNFSSFSFSGFKLNFNLFGTTTTSTTVAPETCDIQRYDTDGVDQCVDLYAATSKSTQTQKDLCEDTCQQIVQDQAPSSCLEIGMSATVPVPELREGTGGEAFTQGADAVHGSSGFSVSSDVADGSNYEDVCKVALPASAPSKMVSDTYAVNQVQKYQVLHTMLEQQRLQNESSAADTLLVFQVENSRNGFESAEIDTCEEYAYKKFWELSQWEDAIASAGDDYVTMWKVAYGQRTGTDSGSIGIRTEASADCESVSESTTVTADPYSLFNRLASANLQGNLLDAQRIKDSACEPSLGAANDPFASRSLTLRPKNTFFKTVLADNGELFPGLTGVVVEDDGLRARLAAALPSGRQYHRDGWNYHRTLGEALASEDPEQMAALYSLRQEYNELIAARNSVVDSLRSSCNVLTETLDAEGVNSSLISNVSHLDVADVDGLNIDYFEDAECFEALQGYFDYVNNSDASAFTVAAGETSYDEALRNGCGHEVADALAATFETHTYHYMGAYRPVTQKTVTEFTKFQVVDPNEGVEYDSLVECMEDPSGTFHQSKLALEAIDRVLESTLATAESLGCFDLNQDGTKRYDACDWSHKDFVDDVKRSYTAEREDAFKACESLLEDDQISFRDDRVVSVWPSPETPKEVEAYLTELRQNRLNVGTVIRELQENGLMDKRGNFAGGGIAHGKEDQSNGKTEDGDPMFGADFSHRLGYGARVLDHLLLQQLNQEQYQEQYGDARGLFTLVPNNKDSVAIDEAARRYDGDKAAALRHVAVVGADAPEAKDRSHFKLVTSETALSACLSNNLYAGDLPSNDVWEGDNVRLDDGTTEWRYVMKKSDKLKPNDIAKYLVPRDLCIRTMVAEGSAYGNVNLKMFGQKLHPIMDVYAAAGTGFLGSFDNWDYYLGVDVRVLSPDDEGNWDLNSVYTAGSIPPRPEDYNDPNSKVLQGVIDNLSESPDGVTKTMTRTDVADWNKRQTVLKSTTVFYLSFIPMTVEAGISGGMGLALTPVMEKPSTMLVNFDETQERSYVELRGGIQAEPWVDFNAYASAAAGVPGFKAGVRADLTILSFGVPSTLDVGIKLSGTFHQPSYYFNHLLLTYDVNVDSSVEVEVLSGKMSLFAEALMAKYSTDIARWPGLQYRFPVLSFETGERPLGEDILRVISYLKD